jgi:hypothetical protein
MYIVTHAAKSHADDRLIGEIIDLVKKSLIEPEE